MVRDLTPNQSLSEKIDNAMTMPKLQSACQQAASVFMMRHPKLLCARGLRECGDGSYLEKKIGEGHDMALDCRFYNRMRLHFLQIETLIALEMSDFQT